MNPRRFVAWSLIAFGYSLIAVSLSLLVVGVAQATVINGLNGASIEYVSGGAVVRDGSGVTFQGRTWDVPSSRTVRATDTGAPLRLGGKDISVNAARTMTPIAIGRASALALKTLPVVGTGIALWDLWDAVRVTPDGAGGLVVDMGADQVNSTGTVWSCSGGFGTVASGSGSSPALACEAYAVNINASTFGNETYNGSGCFNRKTYSLGAATGAQSFWLQYVNTGRTAPGWSTTCSTFTVAQGAGVNATSSTSNVLKCPASIDASNPAYSIPEGMPPDPDGKCRTARYNHSPISAEAAADRLEEKSPPTGEQLKDLAQDAIARGQSIEASERQLSGPTSVPGAPTTTTTQNPDGTTKTVTKTPTTNYTYNTNTVNYSITTVTVTNNNGQVTTETEGTTPEETDACKAAPDSLGCSKMGTPPTDAPQWQTRDVIFTPEDLGFGGSCPAPESVQIRDFTVGWSYEPVCDLAPYIRFALLAFAAIGAISIVIRETNS